MYAWMLRLKQPDGSFLVHEQGEIDVRATYCVVVIATLLGLATDELLDGAASFVASCQTYEGGFAALSTPSYRVDARGVHPAGPVALQTPQGEAHGGYAYCALASYVHLAQIGAPGVPPVHVPRLVRWATSLQGAPIEGGGFRGRTNKLVDGCYGWFCGGGLLTLAEELACYAATLAWGAPPARDARVAATHPVLNVRLSRVAPILAHMYARSS